ncbi:hypothetical protein [Isoptericola haloaureus]|uniref:HTH luxR-type domain-containing protein n=1 Tax=Isoptericola haloaureus TaxID=1542902 RepID=A0ABU7Z3C3_9MICO
MEPDTARPGHGPDLLEAAVGLTPDLLRTYRALVATSSSDARGLAAVLDSPVGPVRTWLDALASRGFATRLAGGAHGAGSRRFVAVPPSVALGERIAGYEGAVRRARAELHTLEEVYRLAGVEGGSDDVVQVVRGPDEVARWFGRVQAGARSEVLAFVQHPVAVTSADENAVESQLVARGVRYQVLLERAMLDEFPGGLDEFAASLDAGEQARVTTTLPLRMIVVDREVAFLPVLADRERAAVAALVVRSGALLAGLVALFEAWWATAVPVVLHADATHPAAGAVDETDARLLSLLLAGHTDEAAANLLGTSLRTVQRRVRDLMERAGVRTRFQLGWHAASAGWGALPEPSEAYGTLGA